MVVLFCLLSSSSDSLDDGSENHPCNGSASSSSLLSLSYLTVFAKAFLPDDFHVFSVSLQASPPAELVGSVSAVSVPAPVQCLSPWGDQLQVLLSSHCQVQRPS